MSDALAPGAPAPGFTLPRDGGSEVSLSDFAGKQVVLYFYPKDDTPGCTKEAIAFTEQADAFAAAGAVVIGVSKDPVAKHDKFIAKHSLGIILVSDENGTTCEDYGVWVEKNMYGKKYMGIERATYLIGADGMIKQVWRKVKVPGHADAVLEAVKA
ncbi:peroxiredoxin [Jannaschia pagri]|uniref:thioredoxin-dependent peroxiredoxin n=1 Tax=Jannaschia pagri TaxID=2829797 RepID=A0ABQ4NPG0_9RHOB|nr:MULTISPECIES: thioredoxin-dependent thiol peroxidase [unclassified Jannaschia]GIT92446.1 peroxiredoxin [Jannaschia sp. AI_61]GIT96281.1 peroxiredoxin [Jannaschia sp. AI_62]